MKRALFLFLITALVTGCASMPRHVTSFPPSKAEFYDAPDGRRWFARESRSEVDKPYWLTLTPDPTQPKDWKEMLSFGESTKEISQASLRATFAMIVKSLDQGFTYQIEGGDDAFIVTYHSPVWNERGIQKVIRLPSGCRTIYYQERLGSAGEAMLRKWSVIIKNTPNQALLPTPTSVTSPAGQEPRRP